MRITFRLRRARDRASIWARCALRRAIRVDSRYEVEMWDLEPVTVGCLGSVAAQYTFSTDKASSHRCPARRVGIPRLWVTELRFSVPKSWMFRWDAGVPWCNASCRLFPNMPGSLAVPKTPSLCGCFLLRLLPFAVTYWPQLFRRATMTG
jgi:hypothetical protein